jgi:hypothetical protein
MPHTAPSTIASRDDARVQTMSFDGFDYGAPAELFQSRGGMGRRQIKYRRFDTAAEALRFAVEGVAVPGLIGVSLEVNETRYDAQEIRYLYDHAVYPLPRTAAV